jgi:glucose-6-phosphate 1-epimerase
MTDVDPFVPIELASADGARVRVLPYGAQVVSWRPAPGAPGGAGERLYLSARSGYRVGAAVRGGVPVIFPQFADSGPFGRHGFARHAGVGGRAGRPRRRRRRPGRAHTG